MSLDTEHRYFTGYFSIMYVFQVITKNDYFDNDQCILSARQSSQILSDFMLPHAEIALCVIVNIPFISTNPGAKLKPRTSPNPAIYAGLGEVGGGSFIGAAWQGKPIIWRILPRTFSHLEFLHVFFF